MLNKSFIIIYTRVRYTSVQWIDLLHRRPHRHLELGETEAKCALTFYTWIKVMGYKSPKFSGLLNQKLFIFPFFSKLLLVFHVCFLSVCLQSGTWGFNEEWMKSRVTKNNLQNLTNYLICWKFIYNVGRNKWHEHFKIFNFLLLLPYLVYFY